MRSSLTQLAPLFLDTVTAAALAVAACDSDELIVQGAGDSGDAVIGEGGDDESSSDGGAPRPSLARNWLLTTLTVGAVAMELPTEVTFDLEVDAGTIGGNGGCNQFGAVIEVVDDGLLALTELVITEMACEPFSILEFESAYLRALGRTTSWEVSQWLAAGPACPPRSDHTNVLNGFSLSSMLVSLTPTELSCERV